MSKLGKAVLELAKRTDDWTYDGDERAKNWKADLSLYNCPLSILSFFLLPLTRLIVMDENGHTLYLGKMESYRIRLIIRRACTRRYKEEERRKQDVVYANIYKRLLGVEGKKGNERR